MNKTDTTLLGLGLLIAVALQGGLFCLKWRG